MTSSKQSLETALGSFINVESLQDTDEEAAAGINEAEDAADPATPQLAPDPLNPATRQAWLAAFHACSRRRGGGIAVGQLGDALRMAGFVVTEAEVAQYRAEAMTASNGRVSLDAFMALATKAHHELVGDSAEESNADYHRLRAALAVFDKPATGRISAADLRHWLTSLGEPIDEADVARMLEHLVDENGLLDYNDLARRLVDS